MDIFRTKTKNSEFFNVWDSYAKSNRENHVLKSRQKGWLSMEKWSEEGGDDEDFLLKREIKLEEIDCRQNNEESMRNFADSFFWVLWF